MRRTFITGIFILSVILFLSFLYIFFKTFSKETISILSSLKRKYLFLSFFLLFLYHTLDNLRLYVLSRALNLRYSFLYGYVMSFVNTFGATVTPAHVGGELASVYMLMRKGGSVHKVMSIVTVKTLSGLSFFILALPFLIFQVYRNPEMGISLLKVFISVSVLFFILFYGIKYLIKRNMEKPKVRGLREALKRYINYLKIFGFKRKSYLLASIIFSVLLYVVFLLIAPVLLKSFGKDVDIIEVFLSQIGLLYAIFISPSPGGSGVGEIGGLIIFAGFLEKFELGIFVIVWRLISQYISAFIGGILFMICLLKDLRGS